MNEYVWFPVYFIYRQSSLCMVNEYHTTLNLKNQKQNIIHLIYKYLHKIIIARTNLIFFKILYCLCILWQLSLAPVLVLCLLLVAPLEDLLSLVITCNCMLATEPPVNIKCQDVIFKKEPLCRMSTSIYQNHSKLKSLEPERGAKLYVMNICQMPQRLIHNNPTILIEFYQSKSTQ